MRIRVLDEQEQELQDPYVLRLGGWSEERYLKEAPESQRWEFVRGEVLLYSPATAEHQELVGFLYRLLAECCERQRWGKVLTGPAAVRLSSGVIREPDVFVLAPEDARQAQGVPLSVVPTLIVEVMSPSTRTLDLGEKAQDYAQAGVPEYWAVDPERRALVVHALEKGRERYRVESVTEGWVRSRVVPGLRLRADWLWQEPLPPLIRCLQEALP